MPGNIGLPEFFILTWIIFAFIGYKFAQSKNLPGWIGAALGMFFNIFGILIIALIPRREPESGTSPPPPVA
jgi:hypothetical protein